MTTTDIVAVEAQPITVFGTDEPAGIVARVTSIAGPLADFIKHQGMTSNISGKEYVLAEGWSFMGQMLGVAPVARRVSEVRDPEGVLLGFEAHVELVTRDGSVVGGAIAECSWSEDNWRTRDPFALKSMAQTRATGKAYRMAFGFVMKAAGYEATPAEEMVVVEQRREPAQQQPRNGRRTASKPEWAQELDDAMKEAGLPQALLSEYLGKEATYAAVAEWIQEKGGSVNDLVTLAVKDSDLPF